MTASINTGTLRIQADGAEAAGDPVFLPPDEVRAIAQHLDERAVAITILAQLLAVGAVDTEGRGWSLWMRHSAAHALMEGLADRG